MKYSTTLSVITAAFALQLCIASLAVAGQALPESPPPGLAYATFAGGCFWCMESPYDKTEGVVETIAGYTGGHVNSPTYKQVSAGSTGHYEALRVVYDPQKVSYRKLVDIFWRNVDPYDSSGQFCDKGEQYRAAIFWHTPSQKADAEASIKDLLYTKRLTQKPATELLEAQTFWPAEEYHQDYYTKNPLRYKFYRYNCGRDARLKEVWGEAPH
ncbi:peptide-methionine (S)-S-oxide reductase MsrA [Oleidesulfovibrio sp.]|uniref:peptide-methionine (S)-S-oxide reductase MsrA n=1 Tax=Oleidesulfovibrio sp. TaxID=2909707 RepID=UPI003A840F89